MKEYIELVSKFMNRIENNEFSELDEFRFLTLKNSMTNLAIFYNIYQNYEIDSKSPENQSDLIINLYGLLQALFVGIDSLYEISFALFNNKNQVNINQNERLHEMKYIRNDVVGHPVNRVYYKSNARGISFINFEKTTYSTLNYTTYKFIDGQKNVVLQNVDLIKTVDEFFKEATMILTEVSYLYKNQINFEMILTQYNQIFQCTSKSDKIAQLESIKSLLIRSKILNYSSKNRLFWRIDLLKDILSFSTNNPDMQFLFDVAEVIQTYKIQDMITSKNQKLTLENFKSIENRTDILKSIYKMKKIHPYLKNLHDKNHPHFFIDVNKIIQLTKDHPQVNAFFKEFSKITTQFELLPYSIGYILKNIELIHKEVKLC